MAMALERVKELLRAARSGDLASMKEFPERLDHGQGLVETYSKYRAPEGQTALHIAAMGGRTNICKYLIEVVGLDVNIQDSKGCSVEYYATLGCNHQTVAYLIRKGANVNLPNQDGYTPVHIATDQGRKEILQLLISVITWHGIQVILTISNGGDVEALCKAGTPLCSALSQRETDVVKILLDNNANPNATSANVVSPLLLSIALELHECINMLLKAGADPNLGVNGVMPLRMAVCKEDTEAITCLLKAGANPNVTDFEGMTPLEISALNRYHKGVKVLLPKTNPIPSIHDWTPRGIISAVHSQAAKYQREQKKKNILIKSKTKGAVAFKKKDYFVALHWYTMAVCCDPPEATVFSNRSLCYARLDDGTRALADAEICIALKPDWSKAHYRKGVACEILKDFRGATEAYARALNLEPGNQEIRTALRKVVEGC